MTPEGNVRVAKMAASRAPESVSGGRIKESLSPPKGKRKFPSAIVEKVAVNSG